MLVGPLGCETKTQVLGRRNPGGFLRFLHSRERRKIEGLPLGINLWVVALRYGVGQVVGIRQGVSHLLQLVDSNLLALVETLDDVPCNHVGHVAFLAGTPKQTTVDVVLSELTRSLETLARHVSTAVLPTGVVPSSYGSSRGIRHVLSMSKLPTGD